MIPPTYSRMAAVMGSLGMLLMRGRTVMEVGRLATGRTGRRRLRAEMVEAGTSRGAGGTVVAEAPEVARTSWAVAAKART